MKFTDQTEIVVEWVETQTVWYRRAFTLDELTTDMFEEDRRTFLDRLHAGEDPPTAVGEHSHEMPAISESASSSFEMDHDTRDRMITSVMVLDRE